MDTVNEGLEFVVGRLNNFPRFTAIENGLTLVLEMWILVFMDSWEENHTGHRILKA